MEVKNVTLDDLKTMDYRTVIWFKTNSFLSFDLWMQYVDWWNFGDYHLTKLDVSGRLYL